MDSEDSNQDNSDYQDEQATSKDNIKNYDNEQNENDIIEDHFRKYLMGKNPQMQSSIEMDSSQEEINSKEDIIQTKNEDKIEHLGTGRFQMALSNHSDHEDKENSENENENENELDTEKNDNNYYRQNEEDEKDIGDKTDDKSNKITNNICIIINKPEVDDKENNNNNNNKKVTFDYMNTFGTGNEEDNNDLNDTSGYKTDKNKARIQYSKKLIKKQSKRQLYTKLNKHKKNHSYYEKSKSKNKNQIGRGSEDNYSYVETEPTDNGKKTTLHKKLSQKQKKLQDLERKIECKTNALNEKRSKVNIKEKKSKTNLREKDKNHNRCTTFEEERNSFKNKNRLNEGSVITNDSDFYNTEIKNVPNTKNANKYKNRKNNNNFNIDNKSLNSDDRYFNDIPMTNIQTNKYIEQKIYKTMSPDISNDSYHLSFNKSIEQKRKMLGIPLNKNAFKKVNRNIENDFNEEERKNLKHKLSIFKKRQDEILKNYEKKNILNQKSRENLKMNRSSHSTYNNRKRPKNKNPIRIIYNDDYTNNNFEHENYINENKNNSKLRNSYGKSNKMNYNNSYSVPKYNLKKSNMRTSNSQKPRNNYNKLYNENNNNNRNYEKKKIKICKPSKNEEIYLQTSNINLKNRDSNDWRRSLENDSQKDQKIYENNSYYSKIISQLFNYNDKNSHQNYKKPMNKTYINKNINNFNNNQYPFVKYQNNTINNNAKRAKMNNTYVDNSSPFKTTKIIYSNSPNREKLTIQSNKDGKTIRIIKKRNKTPKMLEKIMQVAHKMQVQSQNKTIEPKPNNTKREVNRIVRTRVVPVKTTITTITGPGRGISALRRINQKIENYKKRIKPKTRRRTKSKNQQFKSSSHLKQKFGKQNFGRVKNKSIRTLPDVNKDAYQNFDFIDDL